jgi:hypothetical protein
MASADVGSKPRERQRGWALWTSHVDSDSTKAACAALRRRLKQRPRRAAEFLRQRFKLLLVDGAASLDEGASHSGQRRQSSAHSAI